MQGKAILAGLGKYLKHLVKLLVLPWLLWNLWNVAKRHQDTDSRAPAKFIAAVVIGFAIFGFAVVKVTDFHGDQIDGMYDNLDARLSSITGNAAYEEAANTGDQETIASNQEGHDFYLVIHDLVESRDDGAARGLLSTSNDFGEKGIKAYDHKDQGVADFEQFAYIFIYPGLIGILFAPILFITGRIVNSAWVPSQSVGFKPYPAASGSLFLLLGAFGIPAALFAAWAFMDVQERSAEGQISL